MYISRRQKAILEKSVMAFAIIVIVYLSILAPLAAGAQSADPTPVCTVTPDGMFCTSSVAMTMTPTPTPVAPTAESTLTPIEPTATTQPTPTNTRRPTMTPTVVISPLPTPTPLTITVSGHAYIDIDGDMAQDANEGGVSGIGIVATNPNAPSMSYSARTDGNGHFAVSLPAGHYIVTAHCPGAHYGIWLCYDEDYPSLTDGAYIAIPLEPYRMMMPIVSRP